MGKLVRLSLALLFLPLAARTCVGQCVYQTISVSRVQGTIVDPSGVPIPNVEVELKRDGERAAVTTTGENGEFSIQAPPGAYDLNAHGKAFAPGFARIDVGTDLARIVRPTHIWMILDVGMTMENCTFATTSRRQFEKAIQAFKRRG
jgi:protocatechuate 3,4-dioxygenase beta subunit